MLVNIIFPIKPFNSLVRSGKAGEILGRILEDIQPESIYFSEQEGCRGAVMVVEIADASGIPAVSEPWFLNFEASCEFRIAMTPDDLIKADLAKFASKWYDIHVM